MDIFLLIVIIFQFAYLAWYTHQNIKERERLFLMTISKDVNEFIAAVEPEAETTKVKDDPRKPVEDATVEEILKAEII